jgi:hypothetical protein
MGRNSKNKRLKNLFLENRLLVIILKIKEISRNKTMDRQFNGYTATQTEKGFHVVFHDSHRNPLDLTFDNFQEFADKYNQEVMSGKTPKLSDEEEVLLSLLQMMLIPKNTIH